ncbi:MAG: hypothetical protein K8R07_09870 [Desulfobacterales bacterium]|nr:hypothetical protein [Desulfobacterales bacterium]
MKRQELYNPKQLMVSKRFHFRHLSFGQQPLPGRYDFEALIGQIFIQPYEVRLIRRALSEHECIGTW